MLINCMFCPQQQQPLMEVLKVFSYGFPALLLSAIAITTLSLAFPADDQDIEDVLERSFDYIIVGGGASGCPLAATLSQKYSVLLVERGGSPYGNPLIEEMAKFGLAYLRTDDFTSISQPFESEDGTNNQRGRVLGGSTAVNGGFYSRAREEDIERAGWDAELVREAYEWVESKIVFPNPLTAWQFAVAGGMVEAGIRPLNDFSLEHIRGTKVGAGLFDTHRRRHTSADLLAAGNPNNLTILLHATVESVIFHDSASGEELIRARGIRFIRSHGDPNKFYKVYLNNPKVSESSSSGDVILSAGPLGSPQILMLSGIGPKEHLLQFNITPLINAREVGQSMQDNPVISITLNYSSQALHKLHPDPPQVAAIQNDSRIIMESVVLPLLTSGTSSGSGSNPIGLLQVMLVGKVAYPASRGWLRLRSRDPRDNPRVNFNYLSEAQDLDECVKVIQLLDRVAASASISAFLERSQSVIAKKDDINNGTSSIIDDDHIDQVLRDYCKEKRSTIYHYHGGCLVGSVVDKDYRILGVEGLRVVDFSTFLHSPGTNPMATVLMLGRYQGVKILREKEKENTSRQNLVSEY